MTNIYCIITAANEHKIIEINKNADKISTLFPLNVKVKPFKNQYDLTTTAIIYTFSKMYLLT